MIKFYVRRITVEKKMKLDEVQEMWRDAVREKLAE